MNTHYHIWQYRRAQDGTIRSMERDDVAYPNRRKANYALSDGRRYWKAGQVLQCVDGVFCQPMPEGMPDRGLPSGSKYMTVSQLADRAKSIRPSAKYVKAMKELDEHGADALIKSVPMLKDEIAAINERAKPDIERGQRLRQSLSMAPEGQW